MIFKCYSITPMLPESLTIDLDFIKQIILVDDVFTILKTSVCYYVVSTSEVKPLIDSGVYEVVRDLDNG